MREHVGGNGDRAELSMVFHAVQCNPAAPGIKSN